jgi:hypothetical protein
MRSNCSARSAHGAGLLTLHYSQLPGGRARIRPHFTRAGTSSLGPLLASGLLERTQTTVHLSLAPSSFVLKGLHVLFKGVNASLDSSRGSGYPLQWTMKRSKFFSPRLLSSGHTQH